MNYDSKPLQVQTSKMRIPFGLGRFENESTGNVSYSLQLEFSKWDTDARAREFHAMMTSMDEKIVDDAVKNAGPWLKQKKASREVCKALYKRKVCAYVDKDTGEPSDRYPPMMRVKVPFWDGKFNCEVYNDAKELVDPETALVKHATVQAILRCERLWFASGNFGVGWRVVQLRVSPPDRLSSFAFVSDSEASDSDDSDSDDDDAGSSGGVAVEAVVSDDDTDSDEEESEDDEPPVVVKKKRGRKKKSS